VWNLLFWLYMINATLLINHEIDSAYWKEWELFRLPGGPGGFVIIHLPLVFLILLGGVWVARQETAGIIMSLVLCASGLIAFFLHGFFLIKGRPEFKAPVSLALLVIFVIVSLVQGWAAITVLAG
jgi:hypothetical protein